MLSRPFHDDPDYQPDIRLCDFGLARSIANGEELRDIRGTLEYVAPEVLNYDPIGAWSDMWSVGVLTYVLLSGYSPFLADTKEDIALNISRASLGTVEGEGLFPDPDSEEEDSSWVTDGARDFISRLLVRVPKRRPTASDCLLLPWLSQVSTGDIDGGEEETSPNTTTTTNDTTTTTTSTNGNDKSSTVTAEVKRSA